MSNQATLSSSSLTLSYEPRARIVENVTDSFAFVHDSRTRDIIHVRNCTKALIVIPSNQRCTKIFFENCTDCEIQILDSVTIRTKCIEMSNMKQCKFFFDEVDVRQWHFFNAIEQCKLRFSDSPTLLDNFVFNFQNIAGNSVQLQAVETVPDSSEHAMSVSVKVKRSYAIPFSKDIGSKPIIVAKWSEEGHVQIVGNNIAQQNKAARILPLEQFTQQVAENKLQTIKSGTADPEFDKLDDEDRIEKEDSVEELLPKIKLLVQQIKQAKNVTVYTGAGISTSCNLSDYRGPQGCWTAREKGFDTNESPDLVDISPSYAHYAIRELVKRGIVKAVISTNLDGLHRRTGLTSPNELVELHGNSFLEVCYACGAEYLRPFDTMTTVRNMMSHRTGRICACGSELRDTCVHFTENIAEKNHTAAIKFARASDLSLVLGTSMLVHPAASMCDKALRNPNGKLAIVNLQRTPYDDVATWRGFCKTDLFFELLMKELGIDSFDMKYDELKLLKKQNEDDDDDGDNDEAPDNQWLAGDDDDDDGDKNDDDDDDMHSETDMTVIEPAVL